MCTINMCVYIYTTITVQCGTTSPVNIGIGNSTTRVTKKRYTTITIANQDN